MKRRDLVRRLRAIARDGQVQLDLVRQGSSHEIWTIGTERLVIPRHREVNEYTAEGILRRAREVATGDS